MRPCHGARPSVTVARDRRVVGDQRPDQAALAAGGEGDGLVERVVRQHGADRPERLDVVRFGALRSPARSRTGAMKAPTSASRRRRRPGRDRRYTISAEPRSDWMALRTSSRWSRLASAPMRDAVVVRVADGDLGERWR